MAAITKARLTAACEAAKQRVKDEMHDTVWASAVNLVCSLHTKYMMKELEDKE